MATFQDRLIGNHYATTYNGSAIGLTNIVRNGISLGTANQVLVNDGSGFMSSEAQLATSRGGTGQNFSSVGAGPFIITNTSGTMASTLQYAMTAMASTLVQRDGSGNATVAEITASQINTNTVSSTGDLTIATTGGNVQLGINNLIKVPTTVAGGFSGLYTSNVQTTDTTPTALFIFATVSNCSYAVDVLVGLCSLATGSTGHFKFNFKVKNVAGTVTASTALQKASALDSALTAANVDPGTSGLNFVINVTGVAATTIKWIGTYTLVSQLL